MLACDHIALVVPCLEQALARLPADTTGVEPIQDLPDHGLRTVRVGRGTRPSRLLLAQPTNDDSPFARALAKRGPGLHHLMFTVRDPAAFTHAHPKWLLHPRSLETWPEQQTLWLARPGVGTLLGVRRGELVSVDAPVVTALEIPVRHPADRSAVERLSGLTRFSAGRGRMTLDGRRLDLRRLVGRLKSR